MIDGIIKNDGTSRLMRATLPATYEEFKSACEAGTQSLDVLFNEAGWAQLPDFLNKGNLWEDTTAALFGLGADSVPNDGFAWLGKYNQHWWKRKRVTSETETEEYVQSSDRYTYPDSGESGDYEYSYLGIPFDNAVNAPEITIGSYVGTGKSGSINPNTLTFEGKPFLVFVRSYDEQATNSALFITSGLTSVYKERAWASLDSDLWSDDDSPNYRYAKLDNNNLQWYYSSFGDYNVNYQLNIKGKVYYYMALYI